MKHRSSRTLLLFIALIYSFQTLGQSVVISTLEKQFVYFNINNPLNIGLFNYSEDDLILKTNNGEIFKLNQKYYLKPTNENAREVNIYCYLIKADKMDTTLVSTVTFKVIRLPVPEVKYSPISGHSGYPIWSDQGKLILTYQIQRKDLKLDSLSSILSFDISIKDKKAKIDTTLNVQGNRMPTQFKDLLYKCHKNAEVEFFNIRIREDWENPTDFLYDKYFDGVDDAHRKRLTYKIL